MKNKLLLCACAVACFALVSCRQEKADIDAINTQVAQKTLQGIYMFIEVDSAVVATKLHEWVLTEDGNGKGGHYRVASTGNAQDGDALYDLKWSDAKMADNKLSMIIPAVVDGKDVTLIWRDGVIETTSYVTEKSVISQATTLRTVSESFANMTFAYNDTTYYLTILPDTIYYLAWKTEVVSFTQDSIDAYKQFLIDMADTLKWFNQTYPERAVPDTVRFSPKQQSDGTYKGQISRPYETFNVEMDTTNNGPLSITNGEMVFNRSADMKNTGSYSFRTRTWTKEFYDEPTSKKALSFDSAYVVENALWTPIAFTNVKKFDVLVKGKETCEVHATVAGTPTKDVQTTKENMYYNVSLSGFNADEGVVTHNEIKYKTK